MIAKLLSTVEVTSSYMKVNVISNIYKTLIEVRAISLFTDVGYPSCGVPDSNRRLGDMSPARILSSNPR